MSTVHWLRHVTLVAGISLFSALVSVRGAGPDLITSDIPDCAQQGRDGTIGSGIVGLGCGSIVCNIGDEPESYEMLPSINHPVIVQNLYRMRTVDGSTRFEQIGQSWVKHTFASENLDNCGMGCIQPPNGYMQLGVGCSDTYGAIQIEPCSLGPRSAVNPFTGVMLGPGELARGDPCGNNYPASDHRGHTHPVPDPPNITPGIAHRLQVHDVDLDPLLNPGGRYFAEVQYIGGDEFLLGNGNQFNNASHLELMVSGPSIDGVFTLTNVGDTITESPALDEWAGATQRVIEPAPAQDGRAILAFETTDLGGGTWHYEYVVYNMNLERAVGSLRVLVPSGVTVSNAGFHAPPNHAPELHAENYPNTPWAISINPDSVVWSTDSYDVDPLANAVRYGTACTFWYDADAPPEPALATVGMFKTDQTVGVAVDGPGPQDCDGNGMSDICDLDCNAPGCSIAGCGSLVDCTGDAIPDACQRPPTLLAETNGVDKSRFLSFEPVPFVGLSAIRVRMDSLYAPTPLPPGSPDFSSFEGDVRWVGPPVELPEFSESGPPYSQPTWMGALLQCEPYYATWEGIGTLHVYGAEIMPSSTYTMQQVADQCGGQLGAESVYSAPLVVATSVWGDAAAPYAGEGGGAQPDFSDISAVVDKFLGAATPPKVQTLLRDNVPPVNATIDFHDISLSVDGFLGQPYPHSGPCTCPSTVTCPALDACGRCTP